MSRDEPPLEADNLRSGAACPGGVQFIEHDWECPSDISNNLQRRANYQSISVCPTKGGDLPPKGMAYDRIGGRLSPSPTTRGAAASFSNIRLK